MCTGRPRVGMDRQHTWTDHPGLEGFSPGENEYAFGIEDFFGDGIYSDGGYKVTGPDGAVNSSGRRGSQMFGSAKDSVLDDGNRFYSLKVV